MKTTLTFLLGMMAALAPAQVIHKISELPTASSTTGADVLAIVQSGSTKQLAMSAINTYLASSTQTLTNKTISGSATGMTISNIGNASLTNSTITIAGTSTALGGSITESTMLDSISNTQGTILYRNDSAWVALSPGTSGQVLATQGAGANLRWIDASGGTPGGSSGQVQYNNSGSFAGSANLSISGTTLTVGNGTTGTIVLGDSSFSKASGGGFVFNSIITASSDINNAVIARSGELGTGMYFPGSNIIGFINGNASTESGRFSHSGGFSVGTTTDAGTGNVLVSGTVTAARVFAAWTAKTTTYTAVAGDRIAADTSGGAFTITLPASPSDGDWVMVADAAYTWGSNNCSITTAANVREKDGGAGGNTYIGDFSGGCVLFVYHASGTVWESYASQNTINSVTGTFPVFNDGTSGNVTQINVQNGIIISVTVAP